MHHTLVEVGKSGQVSCSDLINTRGHRLDEQPAIPVEGAWPLQHPVACRSGLGNLSHSWGYMRSSVSRHDVPNPPLATTFILQLKTG